MDMPICNVLSVLQRARVLPKKTRTQNSLKGFKAGGEYATRTFSSDLNVRFLGLRISQDPMSLT
jgi:hypothetical protein